MVYLSQSYAKMGLSPNVLVCFLSARQIKCVCFLSATICEVTYAVDLQQVYDSVEFFGSYFYIEDLFAESNSI